MDSKMHWRIKVAAAYDEIKSSIIEKALEDDDLELAMPGQDWDCEDLVMSSYSLHPTLCQTKEKCAIIYFDAYLVGDAKRMNGIQNAKVLITLPGASFSRIAVVQAHCTDSR